MLSTFVARLQRDFPHSPERCDNTEITLGQVAVINQFWGVVSDHFDPANAAKHKISLKRAMELNVPRYTWGVPLFTLNSRPGHLSASRSLKDIQRLPTSWEVAAAQPVVGIWTVQAHRTSRNLKAAKNVAEHQHHTRHLEAYLD